jgi:hypothetical protein
MQPELAAVWRDALEVSASTGVPAAALASAYVRLLQQHAGEQLTTDMFAHAGQQVVSDVGVTALLDAASLAKRDATIAALANRFGVSVDVAEAIFQAIAAGVVGIQQTARSG